MPGTELYMYVRIRREEFVRKIHDCGFGSRYLEIFQKYGCNPLVYQNAAMLRIIAELNYVKVPVVALQQMGLSAAAHFSNQACRVDRHRWRSEALF